MGKKQVLSETFAMCGHNVSFGELKGIYEDQMVRGINLLCQHLEGYSLRGIRKRDYPPAMYYQQPWWSEYKSFVEAMSRIGMLLSEGEKTADVLVIHPQTTAWTLYNDSKNEGLRELNENLLAVLGELEDKHISFYLGDEIIIERHGKTKNGKFIIGSQKYSKVILPKCEVLLENTKKLLCDFEKQGGKIVTADELVSKDVTDSSEITYTKREFEGFKFHYFVNTSKDRKKAKININGKKLNIYSGELEPFYENFEFEPWGSLAVIDDGENLKINGEKVHIGDNELPLDCFKAKGKQKICLTLINNLRNLLGPHHLKDGEQYSVGPWSFFKESCLWNEAPEKFWDDNYCFVETGL